jgi:hypothetical protein
MMFVRRPTRARRATALLVLAMFTSFVTRDVLFAPAAFAASPREELTKAEDYFQVADFSTALQKVNELLKSGDLEGTMLRDAYVLKARSELGLAHKSSATEAFCQAIRVDSAWRPDPDFFTKDEIAAFDAARASCPGGAKEPPKADPVKPATTQPAPTTTTAAAVEESKPWYKKPLVLGILGAAVVGGVVLAMGGGDDDEGDPALAGFPPPPE